jgi:hypothetical protein
MLNAVVVSIRFILLVLCGQKQVTLENAALRQQLAVFKRNVPRPKLNNRDRLSWIGLYMIWQDWKSALMMVQPETVISWHRKRFRRYWWKVSQRKQPGRPRGQLGDPEINQGDGDSESNMGSATGAWGTAEAGIYDCRANRFTMDAEEKWKAVADMDDLSSKSSGPNGLGRLFHSSDRTAPHTVRLHHSRATVVVFCISM